MNVENFLIGFAIGLLFVALIIVIKSFIDLNFPKRGK